MKRLALPALALLAGCADRASDRDPLAGRVAGAPVDCVRLNQNTSPQIVDARMILYRETNRRIWRTGPVGECPGLQPVSMLIIDVYGGQLCRNDRFRVIAPQQSIPSGFCRFDRFTPFDLPIGRSG